MSSAVRITALLLAACLLAGCGDEKQGPGSGTSTPSSRDTSTSSPGVTPAAGTLIEQPMFSFHLPELWEQSDPISASTVTSVGGGAPDDWDFTALAVETWTLKHFDKVTKLSGDLLENFRVWAPRGKVVGVTEWAGQPAYHMVGTGSVAGYAEQFGVIWKGQHIDIRFDFASPQAAAGHWHKHELTAAQRQALIDSVEASWQWE